MGTVTVGTPIVRVKCGNKWSVFARITMSSSYATGGDDISANKFGLGRLDAIATSPLTGGAAAIMVELDPTVAANKVKAYAAAGNQVGNGTDLSTFSGIVQVIGC